MKTVRGNKSREEDKHPFLITVTLMKELNQKNCLTLSVNKQRTIIMKVPPSNTSQQVEENGLISP